MARWVSRRGLLRAGGAGLVGGLAGCGAIAGLFPESASVDPGQQTRASEIPGTVRDTAGDPVGGATVTALGQGGETVAEATAGPDGVFTVETTRPVWLRADAEGYRPSIRAVRPGESQGFALSPAEGTAVLRFGGDVMFGRRFYEADDDPLYPRFRIDPAHRERDHRRALRYVSPLLSSADVTSVNLETPLTDSEWEHPEKAYTFRSHPVAAGALADAGVDYAALGNNHAMDALEPGLRDTRSALDEAGIAYSGAGTDTDDAWAPAVVSAGGVRIAMLSCTTEVGSGYSVDWSAGRDTGGNHTVEDDGRSLTFPESVGVAEAAGDRLREHVTAAGDLADVVVVQIHGGESYRRAPTDQLRRLTETAAAAGADLVVNHHPHVVGGVERIGSTVVAWSLGNLVFDQTLWRTFPTYAFTARVTTEGVVRASVDPLLIDGYVPYGVVGKPKRWVARVAAGRSGPAFGITDRRLTETGTGRERRTETLSPGIHAREYGWVEAVESGTARLGRDLLPTGTFDSVDVDGTGYDGALWRFGRDRTGSRPAFGREGGGFRLRRLDSNSERAILSNARRIPVAGPLTLALAYRTESESGVEVLLNWYPNARTSEIGDTVWTLEGTGGDWRRATRDLTPPELATHLDLFVRVTPPRSGSRSVDVDDIRLLQWADAGVDGGREYDHLRVEETATVRFGVTSEAGTRPEWSPLGG